MYNAYNGKPSKKYISVFFHEWPYSHPRDSNTGQHSQCRECWPLGQGQWSEMEKKWYNVRAIRFRGKCNKWYNCYNTYKKLFKHRYGQDWAKRRVLQLVCTLSSRSAPYSSNRIRSCHVTYNLGNRNRTELCHGTLTHRTGRGRRWLRWPGMNRRSWRCSWPRWPFIVDMTTNTVIFRNNCWKKKSNVNWIQLQKYKLHNVYKCNKCYKCPTV